jgi:hypothetical protein
MSFKNFAPFFDHSLACCFSGSLRLCGYLDGGKLVLYFLLFVVSSGQEGIYRHEKHDRDAND